MRKRIIFNDKFHFKNYVRKIAESCGFNKFKFDNSKLPKILCEIYDFEKENEIIIKAIGANSIIDHFVENIQNLYFVKENDKYEEFIDNVQKFDILYNETKIVCNKFENIEIVDGYNLYNYLDRYSLKKISFLKSLINLNNPYNRLNDVEEIPSFEFKEFIDSVKGKSGLYFLYNENKDLLYIGKSTSLGDRIISSIIERRIKGFVCVALTKTSADIHFYEPYYIIREKPKLNV
jgi:hypothetical protein